MLDCNRNAWHTHRMYVHVHVRTYMYIIVFVAHTWIALSKRGSIGHMGEKIKLLNLVA